MKCFGCLWQPFVYFDELLIEAVLDEVDAVKAILKEEMEHAATLAVPLEIDMHTGHNWYELK